MKTIYLCIGSNTSVYKPDAFVVGVALAMYKTGRKINCLLVALFGDERGLDSDHYHPLMMYQIPPFLT